MFIRRTIEKKFKIPIIKGNKPIEILSLSYYTNWYDIFYRPKKISVYLVKEDNRIYIESNNFKEFLFEVEVEDIVSLTLHFNKDMGLYYMLLLPIDVEHMEKNSSVIGLNSKISSWCRFFLKTKFTI